MRLKAFVVLLACVALLLGACGGGDSGDAGGEEASETEATTPSPTSSIPEYTCPESSASGPGEGVVYENDVTNADPFQPDDQEILHTEGECLILATGETGKTIFDAPPLEDFAIEGTIEGSTLTGLPTMAVEADITTVAGGLDNLHGLVCGVDETLMYFVGMSNEGRGVIAQAKGDGSIEVIKQKENAVDPIAIGTPTRVRAECDVGAFEGRLSVYADGQVLVSTAISNVEIFDRSESWQTAGIVMGTGGEGAAVAFDNLSIHAFQS